MQTHPKYGFTLGFKSLKLYKKKHLLDVTIGFNIELKLQDWFLKLEKSFPRVVTIGI